MTTPFTEPMTKMLLHVAVESEGLSSYNEGTCWSMMWVLASHGSSFNAERFVHLKFVIPNYLGLTLFSGL